MTFRQLSERAAELHQPPTPTFGLESWTVFHLVAPHYLDITFRCRAHAPLFRGGYIGLFWASYIDGPEDKGLYFLGGDNSGSDLWTQLCTQRHYDESTVRHRDDRTELTFGPESREALYRHLSPLRYGLPFFYGLFEEHLWMLMFDRAEGIRFTHSPSGGGVSSGRGTTNPAWDFQFLVPEYEVGREYGFRARAVFRPRCARDEVLEEYRRWRAGDKGDEERT